MFRSSKTCPSLLLSYIISLFARCKFANSNWKRLLDTMLCGNGKLYIESVEQHLTNGVCSRPIQIISPKNYVISSEVKSFYLFSRAWLVILCWCNFCSAYLLVSITKRLITFSSKKSFKHFTSLISDGKSIRSLPFPVNGNDCYLMLANSFH